MLDCGVICCCYYCCCCYKSCKLSSADVFRRPAGTGQVRSRSSSTVSVMSIGTLLFLLYSVPYSDEVPLPIGLSLPFPLYPLYLFLMSGSIFIFSSFLCLPFLLCPPSPHERKEGETCDPGRRVERKEDRSL